MKQKRQALYSLALSLVLTVAASVPALASVNPYTGDETRKYVPIIIGVLAVSAVVIVVALVMSKNGKGKGKKGKKRTAPRK